MPLPSVLSANVVITPETNFVRLRGLPFSATEDDVRSFLDGIITKSITFTLTTKGRASGECYVELSDTGAVKDTLLLHKKEMNGRYIEVFSVTEEERSEMVRLGVLHGMGESAVSDRQPKFVVRLRGIPFATTNDDIREFFNGLEVSHVIIDRGVSGKPSGQAFAEFTSKLDAEKALERNRSYLGSRYVEVFRSSEEEMENSFFSFQGVPPPRGGPIPLREAFNFGSGALTKSAFSEDDAQSDLNSDFGSSRFGGAPQSGGPMRTRPSTGDHRATPYSLTSRPAPTGEIKSLMSTTVSFDSPAYGAGSSGGRYGEGLRGDDLDYQAEMKTVFIRGLPFSVTSFDIEQFFKPWQCVEIKLGYESDGRPTGDGFVSFPSNGNAFSALSRNGSTMGTRFIEVFPSYEMIPFTRHAVYRVLEGGNPRAAVSLVGAQSSRSFPAPTSKPVPLMQLSSFGDPFSKAGDRDSNGQSFATSSFDQHHNSGRFEFSNSSSYDRPFWSDVSVKSNW